MFQINAEVPDGVNTDASATLVIRSAGQPSPAVTLATAQWGQIWGPKPNGAAQVAACAIKSGGANEAHRISAP